MMDKDKRDIESDAKRSKLEEVRDLDNTKAEHGKKKRRKKSHSSKKDKSKRRGRSSSLKEPLDQDTSSDELVAVKEPLLRRDEEPQDQVVIPLDELQDINLHECEKPVSEGGLGYDYTQNIYTVPKVDEKGKFILDDQGKIITHRVQFEAHEIREAVEFMDDYLKGTTTRHWGGKCLQFLNTHPSIRFLIFGTISVGTAYGTFHLGNLLDWNYCPNSDRACRQSLSRIFFNVGLTTAVSVFYIAERASKGVLSKVQKFTDLYNKAQYLQEDLNSKHPSVESRKLQEPLRIFGEYVTKKIATEFFRTLAKEQSVKGLEDATKSFSKDDITKLALYLDIGYKKFLMYLTSEINHEASFIEKIQGTNGQGIVAEKFIDYCTKALIQNVRRRNLQDSYVDLFKGWMGYKTFQSMFSPDDIKYLFTHAAGYEALAKDGKLAIMESADFLKSGEVLKTSDDSSNSIPLDEALTEEQIAKLAKGEGNNTFKYYGNRSPSSMNAFFNLAAQHQYDIEELNKYYGKMTNTINPFAMNKLMEYIAKYALKTNTFSQIRILFYDITQFVTIYSCSFLTNYAGRDYTEMSAGYATVGAVASVLYFLNQMTAKEEYLRQYDISLKEALEGKIMSCAAKKMIYIDKDTKKVVIVPFMMHVLYLTAGVHMSVAEHFHVAYEKVHPQIFLSVMARIFAYYEQEKDLYYVMEASQIGMLIPKLTEIITKSCSLNIFQNWSRCHWSWGVVEKIYLLDKRDIFVKMRESFLYTENSPDIQRMLELSKDIGAECEIEKAEEMFKASIPGILMYKIKHGIDNIENAQGTQKKECVNKLLTGISKNSTLLGEKMKDTLINYVIQVCEKVASQSATPLQQGI